MSDLRRTLIALFCTGALVMGAAACSDDGDSASDEAAAPDAAASEEPSGPVDITSVEEFGDLETGTYFIDPDEDPDTSLRVVYDVADTGWSQWIGAVKFNADGHAGLSIGTVDNLTTQACTDHNPAQPVVGPSVDDLATAFTQLAPFDVTAAPTPVTLAGYEGQHLQLTVPDIEVVGSGDHREFAECTEGNLATWFSPVLDGAFFGYNADPGGVEDLWILDVDGTRLMVETIVTPNASAADVAELDAVVDSIRIEP